MSEFQFNLVKTFLDGFKVPAARIAREWKINPSMVNLVETSMNYDQFKANWMLWRMGS